MVARRKRSRPADMTDRPPPALPDVTGEVAAAERLLADPELAPELGAMHLRHAWERLFDVAATPDVADVSTWVLERIRARGDASRRPRLEHAARWLWEPASVDEPSRQALLDHAALLRMLGEAPAPRGSRFALRLALVAFIGLAVAMAGAAVLSFTRGPQGPWMGQYFKTPDFRGAWVRRDARYIDFDWGKKEPFKGMPEDNFSAVFRTCLVLEEETEVRFRLSSDDGTHLFVDGALVVDNWGAHPTVTKVGKAVLGPGKHELRIHYFEAVLSANLKLEVALGRDGDYGPLSPSQLRHPGNRKGCS